MASPVSFGDAVAMSKIAWRVAHAFTKGRKSAPAEFREVENQLYSLSAALTAFKDVCSADVEAVTIDSSKLPSRFQSEEQDGMQTVSGILDNCGQTLRHLEKIVEDYSAVITPKDPTKSRLQRWSAELVRNYKKIAWTTEAGDLVALRSQLMVHTNSLDLVLGLIVSSRTTRLEESLKGNSHMLKEIHTWWAQNLRDATAVKSEMVHRDHSRDREALEPITFEVYLVTNETHHMLCPKACVHDGWRETAPAQLFMCRCLTGTSPNSSRHSRVESIALSPLCFPFRQAGNSGSWTLFKALDQSTSQISSVVIKNVPASGVLEFEDSFVRPLAEARAMAMLQQGISSQLVHLSSDAQRIRTLNLQSDLKNLHKFVDAVSFRVGHRSLSKPAVSGLSLLNFSELGRQDGRSADAALDYAELSIHYDTQGVDEPTDITKTMVYLHRGTILRVEEARTCVVIEEVECLGYVQDEQVNRLEKAHVTFRMTSPQAAKKLHEKLEEMRMELFITSLQYPRSDEVVALHLQATEVQCEVAIITDAELLIARNKQDQYRLIVTSRNRCTVLTQVLPEAFFVSPSSQPSRFASPTWLVQLEEGGKRKVYHYPKGFRFLSFRNNNAEKMFELGRSAILQRTAQTQAIQDKTDGQ